MDDCFLPRKWQSLAHNIPHWAKKIHFVGDLDPPIFPTFSFLIRIELMMQTLWKHSVINEN